MRILYKLLHTDEWKQFQKDGRFMGSAVDLRDGFIHFSYADQLCETARKHFSGYENLVLLAVSPRGLEGQLRDEISRGGALFPHLYSAIFTENIIWTRKIELNASGIPVLGVLADQL
jgi:uncharacterized protein (DUF952 family)